MKSEKVRIYPGEEFREIEVDYSLKLRYAVSNYGRMVSFSDEIKNGRLLKGTTSEGYKVFRFKIYRDKKMLNSHLFIYKLVAQYFLPKTSDDQMHVLHLDYIRNNDYVSNLKWATEAEKLVHSQKSPLVLEARKKRTETATAINGHKLTVTRVMLIKKLLANPKQTTRLKMIAKQFGVSEMQIRRIKSGENWGYIKV
ncbi:MAG: NUMOD4 domain-containing protein [Bacteroidales bacterium]|nr:NUMOD4 domain-containing protein [Bacteroidales bacterium]